MQTVKPSIQVVNRVRRGLPYFGCLLEMRRDPLGFHLRLLEEYPEADIINFRLGPRRIHMFTSPELIRRVFVDDERFFEKDRVGSLRRGSLVLGNGLVTSEGEEHSRQRKLIRPMFAREKLCTYSQIASVIANDLIPSWDENQDLNIAEAMGKVSTCIIGKILFDLDLSKSASVFTKAVNTLNRFCSARSIGSAIVNRIFGFENREVADAIKLVDEFVNRRIDETQSGGQHRGDLLSGLVFSGSESGQQMDRKQLRDEVMTLFVAGQETIAAALSWTWELLISHPEVLVAVENEVDEFYRLDSKRPLDSNELKLCERVLAEAMRIHPPIWAISRTAVADYNLKGFSIKRGDTVALSQYMLHRNPKYFPDPLRFDPSRWERIPRADWQKLGYLPFGTGKRICIGEPLAWAEGMIIMATVLKHWKLKSLGRGPAKPIVGISESPDAVWVKIESKTASKAP